MASNKKGKRVLSRDQILKSNASGRRVFVAMPEWGDGSDDAGVYVIAMTLAAREEWRALCEKFPGDSSQVQASFISFVTVDESGQRLFTVDDVEALKTTGFGAAARIFEAGQKLNRFGESTVEELEKN